MVVYLYDCPVCGRECCTLRPEKECAACEKRQKKELKTFLNKYGTMSIKQLVKSM